MALDRDGNEIKCGTPEPYASTCLVCQQRVVIHCSRCTLQMSGCLCTLTARIKRENSAESN